MSACVVSGCGFSKGPDCDTRPNDVESTGATPEMRSITDCDSDSDCAPGHVCAHDVGADYGYDPSLDICLLVTVPYESFAGRIIDHRGDPVATATVRIHQVETVSGDNGAFSLSIAATPDDRYVINVAKNGYAPSSQIHVGDGVNDLTIVLQSAHVIGINPSQNADIADDSGTRLTLNGNALVDDNGEPPKGPITVQMHTYDLIAEPVAGNMEAIDDNGAVVMLESIGAVFVNVVGGDGKPYQLAPSQTAHIAVELPDGMIYEGFIPLWYYDEDQGRWLEHGTGFVMNGIAYGAAAHFAVWNFAIKRTDPACIKVTVPDALAPADTSVQARVVVPPPFPRIRMADLNSGDNALYNLPPDTEVEIFIPPAAITPLATVNTGASWGGSGVPPRPYTICGPAFDVPVAIPATTTRIVAGSHHSCAIQGNSNLRCWGKNDNGQLGYGHTDDIGDDETLLFAEPVDVGAPVSDLALGGSHTCALSAGGAVRCWGYNGYGQLGYGHTSDIGDDETPASAGDVDIGGTVIQIAAGDLHTCALLSTGVVRCWGYNYYGQLGYGHDSHIGYNELPATAGDVDVGGTVSQITAGAYHTCALLNTGAVRCWGYNLNGQLGYGHTSAIGDGELPATAGDVDVGGTVSQIAAGAHHTCALLSTGTVRCWGGNYDGQLGYGNTGNIGNDELPAIAGDVDIGSTVSHIAAGGFHNCALLSSGAVRCWGENEDGQLGYGNTSDIGDDELPATAGDASVGGAISQLTAGWYHTCAALDTGAVRCWGRNANGQLGYGHTSDIGDNETPASVGDIPGL